MKNSPILSSVQLPTYYFLQELVKGVMTILREERME